MKTSSWHSTLVLLSGICLANTISTQCYGQDPQSEPSATATTGQSTPEANNASQAQDQPASAAPAAQGGRKVIVLGTPPEGYVPPSEEVVRFTSFFGTLRAWDAIAKQAADDGNPGLGEHFRTMLERESGLTASEAAQVKRIAFQYLQDEKERGKSGAAAGAKWRSANPNMVPSGTEFAQESAVSQQEFLDLANKAIAELLTALGSRHFSRLDLYTRHEADRMKAMPGPPQPGDASPSGVK